ncbi:MAG: hypothetical protein ACKVOU_09560 [Cytophagales bacterium]
MEWNKNQYQGIITHSVQAFIYSCLPLLLLEFTISDQLVWTICTLILGFVTIVQATGVLLMDRVTKIPVKILMFCLALSVFILQLSYVYGFINPAIAVYNMGVFWHLFQSIYLIVSFIINVEVEQHEETN